LFFYTINDGGGGESMPKPVPPPVLDNTGKKILV